MKMFAITIALAGSAAVAPLSAQARPVILNPTQQSGTNCAYTRTNSSVGDVIFGRANTSNCQDVYSREDGAWYQIGRGNTYERRIRDRNGNLVIQHARRNPNGTFTILNTRSGVNDKQWRKAQRQASRQDCTYSQSTNSVGDIIFGRSGNNTTNCVDNTSNRVNGGWYQVGRDNNGATIYERQTRDRNGNLIIQRARRNSNGTLSVISTRNAGNVNGGYNNSTYNNGTYNPRRDRENEQGDNDNDHGKGKGNKNKDHGNGKGHDRD